MNTLYEAISVMLYNDFPVVSRCSAIQLSTTEGNHSVFYAVTKAKIHHKCKVRSKHS